MPELPDLRVYLEALRERVVGQRLEYVRTLSPFVLRSVSPPLSAIEGQVVDDLRRVGKRIVFVFPAAHFLVVHLMVAGRFRWSDQANAKLAGRIGLASLGFSNGTLFLTEAAKKKRASLTLLLGEDALEAIDPGGLDVFKCDLSEFRRRLATENHTLKRALTDPRLFSGIGNAYSDEILNAAGLSPVTLTGRLGDAEVERLFEATRQVLTEWTDRLLGEFEGRFPGAGEITAFRPDFSVHGKFGQPCGRCGTAVQRIRYADRETNYCPRCQTGGKVLADRSLSRFLKDDWPRTLD